MTIYVNLVIRTRDTTKANRVRAYFDTHPELKAKPVNSKFGDKLPFAYNLKLNDIAKLTPFIKASSNIKVNLSV